MSRVNTLITNMVQLAMSANMPAILEGIQAAIASVPTFCRDVRTVPDKLDLADSTPGPLKEPVPYIHGKFNPVPDSETSWPHCTRGLGSSKGRDG